MRAVFKYKKTIVVLALVLLTVVLGASVAAYSGRVIKTIDDDPTFCYDLKALRDCDDPLKYANAKLVFDEAVKFSEIEYNINGYSDIYPHAASGKFLVKSPAQGDAEKSSIKVYQITNVIDNIVEKYAPSVDATRQDNGSMQLKIITRHWQYFRNEKGNAMTLKYLIVLE